MIVVIDLLSGICLSNLLGCVVSNFRARCWPERLLVVVDGTWGHMIRFGALEALRIFELVEKPFSVVLIG